MLIGAVCINNLLTKWKIDFKIFSHGDLTQKILKAEASRYFLETERFGVKTPDKEQITRGLLLWGIAR